MKKNTIAVDERVSSLWCNSNEDYLALSKLYDKYSPALMGIIYNIAKEKTIAEEILQKTFLVVWEQIRSPQFTQSPFFTQLLQIARRTASEHMKTRSLQNPEADDSVYLAAERDIVENNFSAKYQKPIFELLYLKGLCYEQVSSQLKIPVEEVKINFRLFIKNMGTVKVI